MSNHHITGRKGEEIAADYLLEKQYEILHTNWRHKRVEIDIIAKKEDVIVFVEVKTRKDDRYGYPEEAVDSAKQENLQKAAEAFIEEHNISSSIRFDIISIILKKDVPQVYHIEDAFFPYDE